MESQPQNTEFRNIPETGLWKYHARLVRPNPISFRTSRKFLFTCPWTSTMYKVNTILYFIF